MSQLRGKSSVAIFDTKELRRASIISLLEPWAKAENLRLTSFDPNQAREALLSETDCRMLIFSVGGESIAEKENLHQLKVLRTLAPTVPLVVISDRKDGNDIAAAFSVEAQGYLYSGIASALARRALSFILNGGSYFPPSAVNQLRQPTQSDDSKGGPSNDSNPDSKHNGHSLNSTWSSQPRRDLGSVNLTVRQREVLEHICLGESNKLIARRLGMREGTVKVHVRLMMRKCGASNRTQLALSRSAAEIYSRGYDDPMGAKSAEMNLGSSCAPTEPKQSLTIADPASPSGVRH
jgi:DNA-binding NarL/FixJ family response regulator